MSTKRQPSKQRRQSQNRAQREALEKRRRNVEAGTAPAGKVGGESSSASSASKGSLLSRLTGSSRATGTTSGSTGATGTKAQAKPGQKQLPTGYRAALTAVFLAVVGVVFAVTLKAPVDHTGETFRTRDDKMADWAWSAADEAVRQPDLSPTDLAKAIDWQPGGSKPYVTAELPYSLAIVLPLAAAGLAFWTIRKGGNSKLVNRCMYASLFGALLTQQLAIMFLPAAIAIGVAGFQLRKEEMANLPPPGSPDDGVIDVDEVDADDDDEIDDAIDDDALEVDALEVDDVDDVIEATAVDEPVAVDEPDDVEEGPQPPRRRAGGGLQLTNRDDD